MKQFLTVLKFELNNYFKNKSFMVTTLLLMVLVAGVIIVPTLIPGLLKEEAAQTSETQAEDGEEEKDTLGFLVNTEEAEGMDGLLSILPVEWKEYEDEESLREAVRAGELEAGFVLNSLSDVTYIVENMDYQEWYSEAFANGLTEYRKQQYLLERGLSPEDLQTAESMSVEIHPEILGKDSVGNYAYTYVLVFAVYFLIIFYGQMISVSVTTEKSNRAIEILVTSVNPNSLIFGKVLAGAVAGILQMILILGGAFAAYGAVRDAWGGMLDFLFHIPAEVLAAYGFFAILSYLLYAFLFGALGALVSKTEDISKSATPLTLVYVASFLIAMLGMTDCDSMMVRIASFIPFTSGNAMFIRISMGSVQLWEILLSGALLILSCVVTGLLAAKLFRYGTLHYGNPVKFTRALKNLRNQG